MIHPTTLPQGQGEPAKEVRRDRSRISNLSHSVTWDSWSYISPHALASQGRFGLNSQPNGCSICSNLHADAKSAQCGGLSMLSGVGRNNNYSQASGEPLPPQSERQAVGWGDYVYVWTYGHRDRNRQ